MSDDELRKAAESLATMAEHSLDEIEKWGPDPDDDEVLTDIMQEKAVARRLLEPLPPTDDGELVTAKWVQDVLPPQGSPHPGSVASCAIRGPICDVSWVEWERAELGVFIGGQSLVWPCMTRSEFRSLCRGLRIPLPEPKALP